MAKIYTKGGDKGSTGLFSGARVSKSHALINALGSVDELNSALGLAKAWLVIYAASTKSEIAASEAYLQSMEENVNAPHARGSLNLDEDAFKETEDLLDRALERLDGEEGLSDMLHTIQLELFELGAELASGAQASGRINDGQVERFEQWIDELTEGLPELKNFILPTGHPVAAHLHVARTISRRCERAVVAAFEAANEKQEPAVREEPSSTSWLRQPLPPHSGGTDAAATGRFDPVVIRYLNRLNDLLFVLAREANRVFGVKDEEWHSPKDASAS